MGILTFDNLRQIQQNKTRLEKCASIQSSYIVAGVRETVFLSHRHDDEVWVEAAKVFLVEQGVSVYIDGDDADAPKNTSPNTARLLKDRIKQSKKFIVLASPDSIKSIWIPWELGFADAAKGLNDIAILPVGDHTNDWSAREYFGLYNTIENVSEGVWGVFPQGISDGIGFRKWLNL